MSFQVFTVLTEFQFEAASAIASSNQLAGAVDGISQAADRTMKSVQSLGIGFVSSFLSGPGGGVLGVLGSALYSFDSFLQKQIQFANVMGANGQKFTDNLLAAESVLEDINKTALKFGLPTEDLINVTKLIAPQLMNKGLAGENLRNATDLSRSFLKASPVLGIDPQEAFGQLQRAIEGHAGGGDTLFNRLTGETQAMKQFVGNAKAFNALNPAKRLATLNAALGQFSNNTEAVDMRLNSLTGQMQILKNELTGSFSILKPFGKALNDLLVPALKELNSYIRTHMAPVVKSLTRVFKEFAPTAKLAAVNLMAIRDLRSNLSNTGEILKMIGSFLFLRAIMGWLGISAMSLVGVFSLLGRGIMLIGSAIGAVVGMLGGWYAVLNGIVVIVSTLLAPLLLLGIIFQIISRAIAFAKIADAQALAELAPKIAEITARLAAIWGVFQEGMNVIAEFISPIFRLSYYAEAATAALDFVSTAIGLAVSTFQGLAFAIMEFYNQVKSLMTGGGFDASQISAAYNTGIDEMIQRIFGKIDTGEGALATNVTNISKVEINQDFKQQQEPDRIAFTVADTLLKLARNPTQAANGGFATSGTGR